MDRIVVSHKPVCDIFGALGVWLSIERERFRTSDGLFKSEGTKDKSASARYCTQLKQLLMSHIETVETYIRPDHADSHGLRKGAATSASSGTTCPPPVSSLAARGEWCLSVVLGIYWQFADAGDNYLGRCLAGLDPNSDQFAILPPHFKDVNFAADPEYKEAMELMFGPILSNATIDKTAVLVRCLCAVIYNLDYCIEIKDKYPGHSFMHIPLMSNLNLVKSLKSKITIEPFSQITSSTGIPPHVSMAVEVRRVRYVCQGTLEQVKAVQVSVTQAIHDAIEKRALEEGHITSSRLHELLQTYQENLSTLVTNQLSSFRTDIIDNIGRAENVYNNIVHNPSDEDEGSIPDATGLERTLYQSYNYNGKLGYHVPSAFALPQKTNLRNAWTLWWLGCKKTWNRCG